MANRFITQLDLWYRAAMPAFWLRLKPSFQWSLGIALVVAVWIASGFITGTGNTSDDSAAQAKTDSSVPVVQVRVLTASERNATVTVQGRTQALHEVDVRAEVEGVVKKLDFEKGDTVKTGDVLCEIDVNDRGAKLDQAQALVAQTEKQHEVDVALAKDGFRSKTQVAEGAAALEAARAQQRTQQIQYADTLIRAPFGGFVNDRYVDVGDYMKVGDKCAQIIAPEPFLVVGMVTEQQVGQIHVGDPASADLVTGQHVTGKVRFVSNQADDVTRAFRVEVQVPNPKNALRDGVSADIHIPVRQVKAVSISPAILVLGDSGVVGVRTVEHGMVHFRPVHIVSDGPDGMWISGLPDRATVIVVGQQFVSDGEHVKAVVGAAKAAT